MKIRFATTLIASCVLLAGTAGRSDAAAVTWGAATNISGDSDVTTNGGTLVAAFNVGGSGVPQKTVNGVTFAPFEVSGATTTVGNFKLTVIGSASSTTNLGSAVPPFSNLGSDYKSLLNSGVVGNQGEFILNISGLTAGRTYTFEWWSNDSSLADFRRYTTNSVGLDSLGVPTGNSVGLNDNTTNVAGGLGQFAIGTFVADGNGSQGIMFSGAVSFPVVNAFQLRQTPVVPVPAAAWTGLTTLAGLAGMSLIRRRARRD